MRRWSDSVAELVPHSKRELTACMSLPAAAALRRRCTWSHTARLSELQTAVSSAAGRTGPRCRRFLWRRLHRRRGLLRSADLLSALQARQQACRGLRQHKQACSSRQVEGN